MSNELKPITDEELQQARKQKLEADAIIDRYHEERLAAFDKRLVENSIFTDDELIYSRDKLCPCGHGLAYPKECGPGHYWDCSAILKGIADQSVTHTGKLPFMFYDIKSETTEQTTRGVFKPKPQE